MFSSTSKDTTPKRGSSKRKIRQLLSLSKPGLAIDTSFSRHTGTPPQQVFPYESKTQEPVFGSPNALGISSKRRKAGLKDQLENRILARPSVDRSVSDDPPRLPTTDGTRPSFPRCVTDVTTAIDHGHLEGLPLHKRIQGLRPPPLDLTQDVSPSDRAITIGIDIQPSRVPRRPERPHSPSGLQTFQSHSHELQTPTIVVTPAREDFDIGPSQLEPKKAGYHRPASSVYSRNTNCLPAVLGDGDTPPMPPLSLSVGRQAQRESAVTVLEEEDVPTHSHMSNLTVRTEFEEHAGLEPRPYRAHRLTSQSHLSTPRRSKGWWNVITSPFSAGPQSGAFFWRSPSLSEDNADRQRILDDASGMGVDSSRGDIVFSDRALDDTEPHSALLPDTGSSRPTVPKRSETAPGSLDAVESSVNIYRVPSQGLAASYYDPTLRFPSTLFDAAQSRSLDDDLEGWSPSQSVARGGLGHEAAIDSDTGEVATGNGPVTPTQAPRKIEEDYFTPKHQAAAKALPQEDEKDLVPALSQPVEASRPVKDRSNTQATLESVLSPLSATPVVEHAHMATFMGPHSNAGEQREVELTPAQSRSPPPQTPATLNDAKPPTKQTVIARQTESARAAPEMSEKAPVRYYQHSRNESATSFGLGISDAGSEKALFPPPRVLPQLSTDRFGQLTIRSTEEQQPRSNVPWYRRYFWLLASTGALLVLGMVVLLVLLIPQAHDDTPVQASWLNLTGFPALPIGMATVVQPRLANEVSGCVAPQDLWSCAIPAETKTDDAQDRPNFRFEIRFRNGTVSRNETQLSRRNSATIAATRAVKRDTWTSSLFASNPAPPAKDDQLFVGQYTDNATAPYNGEETPFYMSLLDAQELAQPVHELAKRQGNPYPYPTPASSNSSQGSTNASTIASSTIPRPLVKANGEPADSQMYPLVEAQPLRLYDRGQDEEHYGFYTYFDRSLYASNVSASASGVSGGVTGNTLLNESSAVCTWSQTRLRVQIWTRKAPTADMSDSIPLNGLPAVNSTANDMSAPGSFPYSVTITIDRHGGNADRKGVYCYGLSEQHTVIGAAKLWVDENRAFGGQLVNAAAVPSSRNGSAVARRHINIYGGVDGGSGGCLCQWQNW